MQCNTPFFPGFNHAFGRTPKSALKKLEDARKSIIDLLPGQLPAVFAEALPVESIPPTEGGRDRHFPVPVVVWNMIARGFDSGTLRGGLAEVNATLAALGLEKLASSTSGICQARQRLPETTVKAVHERVLKSIERLIPAREGRTLFVDGTGLQLCDSTDNQSAYPQPTNQKPGCGFPVMQQVALVDAHSGAVLETIDSPWNEHESVMFQVGLIERLHPGDTLVADTAYCSYLNFALLQARGVHAVMDLHQARKRDFSRRAKEYHTTWVKPLPGQRPVHIEECQWDALPPSIEVRYIRATLERKGFRAVHRVIATTDMDRSGEEIVREYFRRWDIELCFRDIKITMDLDFIRAKSAVMARKVIGFGLIAHNLIRWQMLKALFGRSPRRISFTGALECIRHCASIIGSRSRRARVLLEDTLEEMIRAEKLPERSGRHEPRAVKRRPKKHQLLTKPRSEMVTSESRKRK